MGVSVGDGHRSIVGASAGFALTGAGTGGDFNGDSINDIVLTSASADPSGIANAGQAFVVYGHRLLPSRLDLATLLNAGGGDGVYGRVFNGFLESSGMRSNMAGDINDDGFEDLRIAVPYADTLGHTANGQAYIVYGEAGRAGVRLSATSGLIDPAPAIISSGLSPCTAAACCCGFSPSSIPTLFLTPSLMKSTTIGVDCNHFPSVNLSPLAIEK